MAEHIFPQKDEDFNTYLVVVVPYLDANKVRLVISAPNDTAMLTAKTAWDILWARYIDPAQRTKIVTADKNTARKAFEKLLGEIYDDIPESVLNSTDREKTNLKARDLTPTKQPAMEVAPEMEIDRTTHLLHRLRFQNPETPDTKAMPLGQKVLLQKFIGNAGIAEASIAWSEGQEVTTALQTINFDAADVGKTVYYRCCYINSRSQKGPFSDMLSRVVS